MTVDEQVSGFAEEGSGRFAIVPVSISGEWIEPIKERRWVGQASAQEDIVAVAFLRDMDCVSWVKCDRGPALRVRLTLFNYDSDGQDVQVNLNVGDSYLRGRLIVSARDYRPDLQTTHACRTGEIMALSTVVGESVVEAAVMFLAVSDVQFGRNRIWHIRTELGEGLREPLAGILTGGRAGVLRVQ